MSPNYQIRPSKHVERKIFIETFQHLRNAGYQISKYHYLGFGSYYYVDFILFNRFLSIKKMTCLEKRQGISKRMAFNKPFKFIELQMKDIANYLPQIRNDKKYIIWLDYEDHLNSGILDSIGSLVGSLMSGSILIVTVNAQPDIPSEEYGGVRSEKIELLRKKYEDDLTPFSGSVSKGDITGNGLSSLFVKSIRSKIDDAMKGRLEDCFYQIFNYIYKDGQRMLTFGGIIDRKVNEKKILHSLKDLRYLNFDSSPKEISIPPLTVREKLFLDQKINKNKTIKSLPFELEKKEIEDYIEYASHYPTFQEVSVN